MLQLKSDETGSNVIDEARINYLFTEPVGSSTPLPNASPALFFSPSYIEAGISPGDSRVESIRLENRGSAAVQDIQVTLTNPDGSPVSANWLFLSSEEQQGNLAVGETRNIFLTIAPTATVAEGMYEFRVRILSGNVPSAQVGVFVNVSQSGIGNALFKLTDIFTATLNDSGEIIQGLAGASISLQNEQVSTVEATATTDEFGEILFSDLPSGWYRFRARAANHQEVIGRIRIQPGLTASQTVFLDYNLVTIEWSVREITIKDRYEIVLNATFETDVPAPVIVIEPTSISLPTDMRPGDVFNGEIAMTNYGLIRAENVEFALPPDDSRYRYVLLGTVPVTLEAKQRITIPYRVVRVGSYVISTGPTDPDDPPPDPEDPPPEPTDPPPDPTDPVQDCETYLACGAVQYEYECINGTWTATSTRTCWTRSSGNCSNPDSISPTSAGGGGGGFASVSGGGGSSSGGGGTGGAGDGGTATGAGGWPAPTAPPVVPLGDDPCVPTPDGNDCPDSNAPKLCASIFGCRPLW